MVLAGVLRQLSVLATVALLSLAGCASQPDYLFIVPNVKDIVTSQDPAPAYRDAITAAPVSGGKDVSILSIPYISNADFQESLVEPWPTRSWQARAMGDSGSTRRCSSTSRSSLSTRP